MPKILISYRRSDSAGMTGRIFDRLVQKYGSDSVFMDVDNIPFGIDFRTHIRDALLQSDLMLVVIGQRWLGRGEGTETRLNDETDPVRVEVESALKAGIHLIPLLVDGAQMPKVAELPESLRALSYLNAAPVDSGRDFHAHIERLFRSIDQVIEQKRKAAADAAAAVVKEQTPPAPPPRSSSVPSTLPPRESIGPELKVAMAQAGGGTLQMRSHGLIRSPQDFWGGVVLIGVAVFAVWACSDLPGMRGFAFGPGTAPRMFAYCLMGLGVAILLTGVLTDGPPEEPFSMSGPLGGLVLVAVLIPMTIYANRIGKLFPGIAPDVVLAALETIVIIALAFVVARYAPRGPVFITAATLIFAVTVRPLGLVISSYISLVVSAYATEEIRWVETIIWAAVLTLFCSLLFPWGLNLPMQLWPRF